MTDRILSNAECSALGARILSFASRDVKTDIGITTEWTGGLRWARNAAALTSDRRTTMVSVGFASTNQTDDAALRAAVAYAEWCVRMEPPSDRKEVQDPIAPHQYPKTIIWSQPTYDQPASARADVLRTITDAVRSSGMLSSGYLGVTAGARAVLDSLSLSLYARYTKAQCSLTVRDPDGTGSGWAGASSYDWAKIDPAALVRVALEKCIRSQNPVRLEPGRYMAILEPQATYDLLQRLMGNLDRAWTEGFAEAPFFESRGNSKLGRRLFDDRITLSHDPEDPQLGVIPFSEEFSGSWVDVQPYRRVKWVDRGVLTTLATPREYAVYAQHKNEGYANSESVHMSGGMTTIEEMIATTKRGVIVTRFSGIQTIDVRSILLSGYTRDGLWLVEDGKITKTVKNFRFTESPLFAFNNVEQLGVPAPVFSPNAPAVVPPLKVRDFNFSSLADAV